MKKNLHSLGLMSGTSMDGIDASIIKSDGENAFELIDNSYLEYDDKLKLELIKIIDLCTSRTQINKLSQQIKKLENKITRFHFEACKLIVKKNKNINIDLIGFHGQTILHKPDKGYSIQIGDAKLLSNLTHTMVVSNFRENDILNGGQGAPLTPLYHRLILTKIKSTSPSAIINIGGISNITYLEDYNKIISFDTGPGNYLINKWVKTNMQKEFDKDGLIAKSGYPNVTILNTLLEHSYYKKKHPKTLDVRDLDFKSLQNLDPKDGCATLSMLTVQSICLAIKSLKKIPKTILISGGGRKNKFIVNNIKKILNIPVHLIDEHNIDGDFVESQAFAYLAIRTFFKKFLTLPSTTGVKKPCLGGSIFLN